MDSIRTSIRSVSKSYPNLRACHAVVALLRNEGAPKPASPLVSENSTSLLDRWYRRLRSHLRASCQPASETLYHWPTGSLGLTFLKDGCVAALFHHDETFRAVRSVPTAERGVIDVVLGAGKDRRCRVSILDKIDF